MACGDLLEHTSSFTSNLLVLQSNEEDSETYTTMWSVENQVDEAGDLTSSYGLSSKKDTSAFFLNVGER
jgi:hypothetical protein